MKIITVNPHAVAALFGTGSGEHGSPAALPSFIGGPQ